jgi:hypothetical protein
MAELKEQTKRHLSVATVASITSIITPLDNFLKDLKPKQIKEFYFTVQKMEGSAIPEETAREIRLMLALLLKRCGYAEPNTDEEVLHLRMQVIYALKEVLK